MLLCKRANEQVTRMNIELRGINFFNKGAELMLQAILRRVKQEMPDALFVIERSGSSPRHKHLQNGIYTKANFKTFIPLRYLFDLVPPFIRKRLHYITEREIDVVLDCSGYVFNDKVGVEKASGRLGDHIEKWKKQGKKVILLPQAFGPFSNAELILVMQKIISYADLIYARDHVSLNNLTQLCGHNEKIICAPDFTNLIEGIVPSYFESAKHQVAIIVNSKMINNTSEKNADAYINLIHKIIGMIIEIGYKPFFLIHEKNTDIPVAKTINEKLTTKLAVIAEENPLLIKGIISKSVAVITSRFHGLVSCLSQGIPCLATSWSHKYETILYDYNYSEALLNVNGNDELLLEKVETILTEPSQSMIARNLNIESLKQKELSEQMWKQVFEKIKEDS
jgi:polysaccharide pyruvyl transferase WcaK-like protein